MGSPSESFTKLKEQMDRAAKTVSAAASVFHGPIHVAHPGATYEI